MEVSLLAVTEESNARTVALNDLTADSKQKGLNIGPDQIFARWRRKNGGKGFPLLTVHTE
ncbi:hypothetical protein LJC15_04510 [Desulfovibrio sp. OttesenSCG-928-G11]|nr:hypothetical protein [Desulfovibrio sp. OttesenSCG-928-G11]